MMAARLSRAPAGALILFALAGLAACDDSTGPGADFDAVASADAMVTMVATGEELAPAFGSLQAAGDLFAGDGAAMLVASGPALDAEATRRYVEAPRTLAFFPSNYLGVTFAYSAAEGAYVPTEAAGAPADGIRILYYAVDPFTHEPQAGSPLGHIDLRDLSGATSNRLAVKVVNTAGAAPVTLADYYVNVAWTFDGGAVGAETRSEGYLSDGAERLDFDLSQAVMLSETAVRFTQDYAMSLAGGELSVRYLAELEGIPESQDEGTLSMTATVTHQGQAAVFDVAATADALDGTVSYGVGGSSVVVATIGGTPDAPTFTDAAGNPVDPAELEALGVIFGALNALFEVAAGVFGPM